MLPSWIRSRNCSPRLVYFLAIEITSRRLASVISRLARRAFASPVDGARGEADPHQLVGDLVARAQVVLVLRALVLQRLRHLVVEAADARELLERLAAQLQQARRLRGALVFLGFALFLLDLRLLV